METRGYTPEDELKKALNTPESSIVGPNGTIETDDTSLNTELEQLSIERDVNKDTDIVGENNTLETGDSEIDIELAKLAAERAADTGETPTWKFLEEDNNLKNAA